MKIGRMFSIDVELAKKLQDVSNASGLINDLLLNHYRIEKEKALTPEMKAKAQELLELKHKRSIESAKRKVVIAKKRNELDAGKITEDEYWKFVDGGVK